MNSFYHAYQAYERKLEMGDFMTPKPKASGGKPLFHEHLLAGLGDVLIQAGSTLKRRWPGHPAMSGSPTLGKLNR